MFLHIITQVVFYMQWPRKIVKEGANIYIFALTNRKNNQLGKKSIMLTANI